jgi:hypothetical protein
MADRHGTTTLDPQVKRPLQIQHQPDMLQKARVNRFERRVNMKQVSHIEQGREIDLAEDSGSISFNNK